MDSNGTITELEKNTLFTFVHIYSLRYILCFTHVISTWSSAGTLVFFITYTRLYPKGSRLSLQRNKQKEK